MNERVKKKLDRRMLRTLRAFAKYRGDDPARVMLAPFVNHDLRRTLRSGLSKLGVNSDVAEAVLAHAKTGIRQTYDRYEYLDEKRKALEIWSAHLRTLMKPTPANVVPLAVRNG